MKNKKQTSLRLLIILFLIVGGISCYGKKTEAATALFTPTIPYATFYNDGTISTSTGNFDTAFIFTTIPAGSSVPTGSAFGGGYTLTTNIKANLDVPGYYTGYICIAVQSGGLAQCGISGTSPNQSFTGTGFYSPFYLFYNGSTVTSDINPITIPPEITSFTYSTTTNYANVQGYWEATTTTGISQQLNFWQTSVAFGTTNQSSYTATTTGLFNFSFFFSGVPVSNGSSTIDTSQPFTIQAQLTQVTTGTAVTTCPNGQPSDGGFNCPDTYGGSQTTLAATSTTISTYAYTGIITGAQNLTTQNYSFAECTLTHFDLGLCAADIGIAFFVPTPGEWTTWVQNVHDDLLTRFPIGYITDFVNIVSATTTSQLTVINATVPNQLPGGGSTLTLDLTGVLNPILDATTSSFNNTSASSTETLYQITSYYWDILVYIGAGFYIIRRILGSNIIAGHLKHLN